MIGINIPARCCELEADIPIRNGIPFLGTVHRCEQHSAIPLNFQKVCRCSLCNARAPNA